MKKGCIILTTESGPIIHEIAAKLHKEYGVDKFCAYAQTADIAEYAVAQKNIPYTRMLEEPELYKKIKIKKYDPSALGKFEKEYGPSLWKYVIGDKSIMHKANPKNELSYTPTFSHEQILTILYVFFREIENLLKTEKPDFLINSGAGSLRTYVFLEVAKKLEIKTLDIQTTRIGSRFTVTEDFRYLTEVEKTFTDIKNGKLQSTHMDEARTFLKNFRENPKPSFPFFIQFGSGARFKFLKNWKRSLRMIIRIFRQYAASFFTRRPSPSGNPFAFIYYLVIQKIRSFTITRIYQKPDWNEDFVFFPLQMEPEVSNTILSPYYVNQIELARVIARSLPIRYKLYIKEHPIMRGKHKISYYKKLLQIPNVKLIDDAIPSYDLIRKSRLVITNVSTIGWEALLFKKPNIYFGKVFYEKLSAAKKCEKIEELPGMIKDAINFQFNEHNEEELVQFISAIWDNSVEYKFLDMLNLDRREEAGQLIRQNAGFDDLVALLAKHLPA